jgi:ParB family chromosome partitioning protein
VSGKFAKLSSKPKMTSTQGIAGAINVPVSLIVPNLYQVRQYFDPEALQELAEDIKQRGILEPLLVREGEPGTYQIVAGERRYRAAQLAGLTEVPVIVREMDEREARFTMLAENIQRQDLDPRDEKRFFEELQSSFNLSNKDIARLISKSPMYVQRRLNDELVSLQTTEEARLTQDGEKDNNHNEALSLQENSQSVSRKTLPKKVVSGFNPAVYRRVSEFFDNTIAVVKSQPDSETVARIRESIADAETKLAALKRELESLEEK